MKKGIVAGSLRACLRDPSDPVELFGVAAEVGLDGVELQCNPNGDFDIDSPDSRLKALKKAADAAGMAIPSIMPPWFDMVNPEASVRRSQTSYLKKLIKRVKLLGNPAILTITGRVSQEVPYDVAWDRSVAALAQVVPVAEKAGVTLCLENVWNWFLYSPLEFCRIIDGAKSVALKAYFDVGNFVPWAYPEQYIRILGTRLGKVHVKDFNRGSHTFCRLLEGNVDWSAVRKALKAVGYDDFITAEVGGYSLGTVGMKAAAAESVRAMQLIIDA